MLADGLIPGELMLLQALQDLGLLEGTKLHTELGLFEGLLPSPQMPSYQ